MPNIPVNYDYINLYNSQRSPSTVHCQNAALVHFFERYLLQKVISVFKFEGIPETWALNYFQYVLFMFGYVAIIDHPDFGVIPQNCSLYGYDVFYQPSHVIIANPLIKTERYRIGEECELIKLQPDYFGVMDIVTTYADLMALSLETAGINLLNSKMSYVFMSENKNAAESFKKLYDQFASGNPAVFADKMLFNEDGSPSWQMFTQNVGQNYIADKVLDDMKKLEDRFNTDVGIPNANTYKKERLITDEVNANNFDTQSKVLLWLDTMSRGIEAANNHYGLDLSVEYRYEAQYEQEVYDNERREDITYRSVSD